MRRKRKATQAIFISLWVLTTLSLATWWVVFNFRQVEFLKTIQHEAIETYVRKQQMLVYEGLFLFALLVLGGAGLYVLSLRERKLNELIRQFFATFTHEVKTSLASVRLQAESLEEENRNNPETSDLSKKLVKETLKLELQLENSLFLAEADAGKMFFENLELAPVLNSLCFSWPDLKIECAQKIFVNVDRRALECIFKNLFQNAVHHGTADTITIFARSTQTPGFIELDVKDNGSGFTGDPLQLGEMFKRHTSRSGSGVGLFLVKEMTRRLGGDAKFKSGGGFHSSLILPGQVS